MSILSFLDEIMELNELITFNRHVILTFIGYTEGYYNVFYLSH